MSKPKLEEIGWSRGFIQKRMKEKRLNIPQLARKVGCCQQTLYNYFAKRTDLSLPILERVCVVLRIDFKVIDN